MKEADFEPRLMNETRPFSFSAEVDLNARANGQRAKGERAGHDEGSPRGVLNASRGFSRGKRSKGQGRRVEVR
jgi:hypothetical protein